MQLIKCEINLILTWSSMRVITNSIGTDTKFNVPVATSSTQESAKLLQQLKSSFKITTNWSKYQSKV